MSDVVEGAEGGVEGGVETDIAAENMDDATPPVSLAARVVVWAVFAVLYAYPLFEGVSNLVALPATFAAEKAAMPVALWALLIVGVLVPVVSYGAALLLGRGREMFPRALLLAVGLAASNALFFSVVQWARFT